MENDQEDLFETLISDKSTTIKSPDKRKKVSINENVTHEAIISNRDQTNKLVKITDIKSKLKSVTFDICKKIAIYHGIIFILNLLQLIFIYYGISFFRTTEAEYFIKIGNNWSKGIMTSVSETCDNSTYSNPRSLITDYWPGTKHGCNCITEVFRNNCSNKQTLMGCRKIKAKQPIKFSYWKGVPICVDRSTINYLDLDIVDNKDDCPKGKRSCGIIDSKNNILCIEKNISCPINKIKVFHDDSYIKSLSPNDSIIKFPINKNYFNTSTIFIFSREIENHKIPIDFKISTGKPCKNPTYENMDYPNYVLNKYYGRDKCYEFTDKKTRLIFEEDYAKIDSMPKKAFFEENQIMSIINELPLVPNIELNREIEIYSRSYYGVSPSCLSRVRKHNLQSTIINELTNLYKNDDILSSLGQSRSFATVLFAFMIMLIILIPVLLAYSEKIDSNFLLFYSIVCFCIILEGIFSIVLNVGVISKIKLDEELALIFLNRNCVDGTTYTMFENMYIVMNLIEKYYIISTFFTTLLLITHLVFWIHLRNTLKNNPYHIESQYKKNSV